MPVVKVDRVGGTWGNMGTLGHGKSAPMKRLRTRSYWRDVGTLGHEENSPERRLNDKAKGFSRCSEWLQGFSTVLGGFSKHCVR